MEEADVKWDNCADPGSWGCLGKRSVAGAVKKSGEQSTQRAKELSQARQLQRASPAPAQRLPASKMT